MNLKYLAMAVLPAMVSCSQPNSVELTVKNPLDVARHGEVVEIATARLSKLGEPAAFYVTDESGREIPSQLTSDGLLVFRADVEPGATSRYTVYAADSARCYSTVATGRVHPERDDDLAWENDLGGYRAYGPAIQRKGERLTGYDIFFKHPSEQPVLETLYAAQCSGENWRKADSIRAIDPAAAQEFINSFTYHLDHGLGYDCYAVGATLGAGTAALTRNDSIILPWCYRNVSITDNGPIRFRAELEFPAVAVGADSAVVERRVITLDAGSRLNRCEVSYDGMSQAPEGIAVGFPRRDDSPAVLDTAGIIAYGDPTQGPDNGRALLGAVVPSGFSRVAETQGHVLGFAGMPQTAPFEYYWGFAWDRTDINDIDSWKAALEAFKAARENPLQVVVEE